MKRFTLRRPRHVGVLFLALVTALGLSAVAAADTVGSITFESPAYTAGSNINGQQGWSNTGLYDANVVLVANYAAASSYGFADQALQISNSKTSGSFGDQTFSPGLTAPAGVSPNLAHFTSSFKIGTALATQQIGLAISVSPDNGQGARMSYLRFEDQASGVHVFFDEARGATFKESDIATLTQGAVHTVAFSIDFTASTSKAVKITIDGAVKATGSTWQSYYQTQEHNPTPTVSKMLFRAGGTAAPGIVGNGFLIDNLTLSSSS